MSRWTCPINFFLVIVPCLQLLVSVVPSMATPLPLPLALMMADYSPSFIAANHSFSGLFPTWRDVNLGFSPPHQRRSAGSFDNLLRMYNAANSHASNLKKLAAKSSSVDPDDPDFQSNFANAFTGFNTNVDGFNTALADSTSGGSGSSSDKGLANYDNTNDLETLLKNLVNLNKDVLSATDVALKNLPILGPILGPLVYDLKCLIDRLLDIVENCTDSIINQLQPLLAAILGHAVSTTCRSGVMLLGFCV